MKKAILLLRKVFFGTLAVIGGALVATGLHGLSVECYRFVSKGHPDISGFELSAGLFITGILLVFIGTRFLNRNQSFLSNSWLSSIGISGITLFALGIELFLGEESVFEYISEFIILCFGLYLFRISRKELAKFTSYPNKALSADS